MNMNINFYPFIGRQDCWDGTEIGRRLCNLEQTSSVYSLCNNFLMPASIFDNWFKNIFRPIRDDIIDTQHILSRLEAVVHDDLELYPLFLRAINNFHRISQGYVDHVVYANPTSARVVIHQPPTVTYTTTSRPWHHHVWPRRIVHHYPTPVKTPTHTVAGRVIPGTGHVNPSRIVPNAVPRVVTSSGRVAAPRVVPGSSKTQRIGGISFSFNPTVSATARSTTSNSRPAAAVAVRVSLGRR